MGCRNSDIQLYLSILQQPRALTAAFNYYRASFRQLKPDGKKEKRKKILAPTLLIWGGNDAALDKELTYNMNALFDNLFHLHYIPSCSHWVNEEQPEIVNKLLLHHFTQEQ